LADLKPSEASSRHAAFSVSVEERPVEVLDRGATYKL
jgi:hypothetical protein